MAVNIPQAFLAGRLAGVRRVVTHDHSAQAIRRRFFEGVALHGQTLVKFALLWAAAFLLLGFAEEFAYRGYSQTTLTGGMGFWPAAFLLSAIFGAVHYFFKPMENWMDGLSVGLFGLFWCFTFDVRRPCGSQSGSMRCLTTRIWCCSRSRTPKITVRALPDTC